ncbi:MAG: AAA family ATPase [Candidatus Zixiibacteriota bacterium]
MSSGLYIKTIRFENFGPFNDLNLSFEPGINQVIGSNESGKTALINGIVTALLIPAGKFDSIKSPNRLLSSRSCLGIVISNHQLEYMLIRDYANKTDKLLLENGEEYIGEFVEGQLARIFGKGYLSRLSDLICFSSYSPSVVENAGPLLRYIMEEPVFVNYDPAGIDKKIQDEIENLENGTGDELDSLPCISDKISEHLKKITSIETSLNQLYSKNEELELIRSKTRELGTEISQLKSEIEGAVEYGRINGQLVDLQARLESHLSIYSRASQVADDLDRVDKEINRLNIPDADEMEGFCCHKETLEGVIDVAKDKMDNLIILRNNSGREFVLTSFLLALLCLGYVFQIMGYAKTGFISGYIPTAILLILGFWFLRLGKYLFHQSRKTRATIRFRAEVARLDEFYRAINRKFGLGAADPVEVLQGELRRKQILEMSFENLSGTIGHLSLEKGMGYLAEIKGKMESELAELNQKLSLVKKYGPVSNRISELDENLTARKVRLKALNERNSALTEECRNMARLKSELKELDEKIERLKEKFKNLNEKIEVLKIARLALHRASDRIIEGTYEEYTNRASEYIRLLTSGRYDGIRFRREIHTFEAKLNRSQSWQDVSQFESLSFKEVANLSIFLSMVSSNHRVRPLPIFFNQADSRFDIERRSKFYKALNQLSSSRQVIYLGTETIDVLENSHSINLNLSNVQSAIA